MTKELSKAIKKKSKTLDQYYKWWSRKNFLAIKMAKSYCSNLSGNRKKNYFRWRTYNGFAKNKGFWNTVKTFVTNKDFLTNSNTAIKTKDNEILVALRILKTPERLRKQ